MGYCWFLKKGNGGFFFSLFTSKTLCRLHLIVLVDLIMFTHINNAHINNTFAISLSHASLERQFLLSQFQCWTSRLAASCCVTPGGTGTSNAQKRGARHHAVPHGGAAHARVADASKRAPLIDASGDDRSQCWSRSVRTPLTGRFATRDPRWSSQSTKCAAGGGAYLQLCRVFA